MAGRSHGRRSAPSVGSHTRRAMLNVMKTSTATTGGHSDSPVGPGPARSPAAEGGAAAAWP
jgi:hypothetical protein